MEITEKILKFYKKLYKSIKNNWNNIENSSNSMKYCQMLTNFNKILASLHKSQQILMNPCTPLLEREEAEGRRLNSWFIHKFKVIREIDHRILYNLLVIWHSSTCMILFQSPRGHSVHVLKFLDLVATLDHVWKLHKMKRASRSLAKTGLGWRIYKSVFLMLF